MYIERLSFDELRLVTSAMPVIRPLTLLNLLCFKKKNSLFLVAVYRTCCAKGSKAHSTVTHADPTHGGTRGFCLPVVAARHEHLCFPICTQQKKGLPIVPSRILKTYGCGLAQVVIKINFWGGRAEGLPLFTAPQQPPAR